MLKRAKTKHESRSSARGTCHAQEIDIDEIERFQKLDKIVWQCNSQDGRQRRINLHKIKKYVKNIFRKKYVCFLYTQNTVFTVKTVLRTFFTNKSFM